MNETACVAKLRTIKDSTSELIDRASNIRDKAELIKARLFGAEPIDGNIPNLEECIDSDIMLTAGYLQQTEETLSKILGRL